MHTLIAFYQDFIEPHFDYCSAVSDGLSLQLTEKIQKLQHLVARAITKSGYHTNPKLLLNSLGWQKACMVLEIINKLAPGYLSDSFVERIA